MTDSKSLHLNAEGDFVTKLDNWTNYLGQASENLQALRAEYVNTQRSAPTALGNVGTWIEKCKNEISSVKANLDSVTEILNMRKTSTELKKTIVDAWPRKSLVERLTYISGLLFPAGGIPIALAGGWNYESGLTSTIIWIVAAILLMWSLAEIRAYDKRKWDYFEREFDVKVLATTRNETSDKQQTANTR